MGYRFSLLTLLFSGVMQNTLTLGSRLCVRFYNSLPTDEGKHQYPHTFSIVYRTCARHCNVVLPDYNRHYAEGRPQAMRMA